MKLLNIGCFTRIPRTLLVGVLDKAVRQPFYHTRHLGSKLALDLLERGPSAVIFCSIMQEGGDHHVFRNGAPCVPSLAHHQRSNSEQMRHIGNVGSLPHLGVDASRIINSACKSLAQVELRGLASLHSFAST